MRSAAFRAAERRPALSWRLRPIHREKGKPPAPPRHFAILRIRLPRRMHRLETAFFDEAHKRICRRNAPHSGGSVLVPPPLPVRRRGGNGWFSYGDARLPRKQHAKESRAADSSYFGNGTVSKIYAERRHTGGSAPTAAVLQPPSCRAPSAVPETLALGNLQQPPIQAALPSAHPPRYDNQGQFGSFI